MLSNRIFCQVLFILLPHSLYSFYILHCDWHIDCEFRVKAAVFVTYQRAFTMGFLGTTIIQMHNSNVKQQQEFRRFSAECFVEWGSNLSLGIWTVHVWHLVYCHYWGSISESSTSKSDVTIVASQQCPNAVPSYMKASFLRRSLPLMMVYELCDYRWNRCEQELQVSYNCHFMPLFLLWRGLGSKLIQA